jgi:hypothetical protein
VWGHSSSGARPVYGWLPGGNQPWTFCLAGSNSRLANTDGVYRERKGFGCRGVAVMGKELRRDEAA